MPSWVIFSFSCGPYGHFLGMLANEPILLRVASHSVGFEFLPSDRYRGIVAGFKRV